MNQRPPKLRPCLLADLAHLQPALTAYRELSAKLGPKTPLWAVAENYRFEPALLEVTLVPDFHFQSTALLPHMLYVELVQGSFFTSHFCLYGRGTFRTSDKLFHVNIYLNGASLMSLVHDWSISRVKATFSHFRNI